MKILLLNQCFYPDVVATAQQLSEAARGLAERGHEVTVISSRHGYDDPRLRFSRHERWKDIEIIRLRSISLGKSKAWKRALNFASFTLACAFRLAVTRRHDAVVALTSPPLISWLASMFTRIKGGHLIFWVMDLNPDEAIAAGWLKADSVAAKLLGTLLNSSMSRTDRIVVLDRFMKDRIVAKGIPEEKIAVIPPFSDDSVRYDAPGREEFRTAHNLLGKFVVMHAGNHSPCHSLDTLLESAAELQERDDIVFCFVGGGSELCKVRSYARAQQRENIYCLPYQPQAKLAGLLSAADLHVVVMGEAFRGIVHPSKIYNILATGLPFLYIGPDESHMGDIIARIGNNGLAMHATKGDVSSVVRQILNSADSVRSEVAPGRTILAQDFSRSTLLPRLIGEIDSAGWESSADFNLCVPARIDSSVGDQASTITD